MIPVAANLSIIGLKHFDWVYCILPCRPLETVYRFFIKSYPYSVDNNYCFSLIHDVSRSLSYSRLPESGRGRGRIEPGARGPTSSTETSQTVEETRLL